MKNGAAPSPSRSRPQRAFPPTYKFDKRADAADTSEKRRVPSWRHERLNATAERRGGGAAEYGPGLI